MIQLSFLEDLGASHVERSSSKVIYSIYNSGGTGRGGGITIVSFFQETEAVVHKFKKTILWKNDCFNVFFNFYLLIYF